MRVLLVSANRTEINMRTIPLGLACVASALKETGHSVEILDFLEVENPFSALKAAIEEFKPEVIGISLRNIDDQTMRNPRLFLDEDNHVIEMAKRLSDAPVILGGAGYSMFPEEILTYSQADMGIQGDGEETFRLLLDRLQKNQSLTGLPGLYVKERGLQAQRAFTKNLDQFPLPEADFFPPSLFQDTSLWVPVQTRRGCSMDCSYCSTAIIEGRTLRKRSPGKVVEWIIRLNKAGACQFYFVDNTFNLPASYTLKLCKELTSASLGIKWRCIVYPNRLNEPLVAAMAGAGCVEASVGFESGCENILQRMNKHFRRKDVEKVCKLLGRHGIRRMGFLLLGGPGETRQSVHESLVFADSLDLDLLKITIGVRIYPHTLLAEEARKEGSIKPDENLLFPKFYMTPGLEDWIREIIATYKENRPNWIVDG